MFNADYAPNRRAFLGQYAGGLGSLALAHLAAAEEGRSTGQDPLALVKELKDFAARQLLPDMQRSAATAGIDFEEISHVPGLLPDRDHDFVKSVLAASGGNATHKVSFGTEAGLYQRSGVPTVVCGPGDIAQAHRPDEFVALDQLARCETFLRRMAKSICGA